MREVEVVVRDGDRKGRVVLEGELHRETANAVGRGMAIGGPEVEAGGLLGLADALAGGIQRITYVLSSRMR